MILFHKPSLTLIHSFSTFKIDLMISRIIVWSYSVSMKGIVAFIDSLLKRFYVRYTGGYLIIIELDRIALKH